MLAKPSLYCTKKKEEEEEEEEEERGNFRYALSYELLRKIDIYIYLKPISSMDILP
jgi:hypothetical protein